MNDLEEALRELEDLMERANEITSLNEFEQAISEKTKIPAMIKTSMLNICRQACPVLSPVPSLIVFYTKETISWAIEEIKKYTRRREEMKPTALLTCKGMLPPETVELISEQLDLRVAPCAINEDGIIEQLKGVNYHFMGGEEFYSLRVAQAAEKLKKIFFIGMMPDTYWSSEAFKYLSGKLIPIIPTGGGQTAVVRSTLDIFYNEFLITPLFSRDFRWVAGEPGGMKSLLQNLYLVVIGPGNIGQRILNDSYLDFGRSYYGGGRSKKENLEKLGIHWVPDLKKAFAIGNVYSINLSYSAETHHLIRYEDLAMMRENSLLINSARAALIEPVGFLKFLRRRPDVLVILDVFYVEGKDYEKLCSPYLKGMEAIYAQIIAQGNVLFLQHRFATRHPELAVPEYGENLLRLLREQKIIV